MKTSLTLFLLFLSTTTFLAQSNDTTDHYYHVQNSVMIPTRSGTDLSSIIVHKDTSHGSLPIVLFYTTYYQGQGDTILGARSAERGYVGGGRQ